MSDLDDCGAAFKEYVIGPLRATAVQVFYSNRSGVENIPLVLLLRYYYLLLLLFFGVFPESKLR